MPDPVRTCMQGDPGLTPAGRAWLDFLLGALGAHSGHQRGTTLANLPVLLLPGGSAPQETGISGAQQKVWSVTRFGGSLSRQFGRHVSSSRDGRRSKGGSGRWGLLSGEG